MVTEPAAKAQEIRDLRNQITELQGDPDLPEIVFRETSPRKKRVTIYSRVDGEPISILASRLDSVLSKRLRNGQYMFTAHKEQAPEYRLGNIKCFLHADAPERGILMEVGLGHAVCSKATLGSAYAKRIHGLHRHRQEWAMYQEYLEDEKDRKTTERQERQLEATLAIANRAGGEVANSVAGFVCEQCGKEAASLAGLKAHQRSHGEAA